MVQFPLSPIPLPNTGKKQFDNFTTTFVKPSNFA